MSIGFRIVWNAKWVSYHEEVGGGYCSKKVLGERRLSSFVCAAPAIRTHMYQMKHGNRERNNPCCKNEEKDLDFDNCLLNDGYIFAYALVDPEFEQLFDVSKSCNVNNIHVMVLMSVNFRAMLPCEERQRELKS